MPAAAKMQTIAVTPATNNCKDDISSMTIHNSRNASNSRKESNNRTAKTVRTPAKVVKQAKACREANNNRVIITSGMAEAAGTIGTS